MRWPYLLRRIGKGALLFPLHGHWYIAWEDAPNHITKADGTPVDGQAHMSWLMASAILYRQKRKQDNMLIREARRKAVKWIIYMSITTPIVLYCLTR